MAMKTATEYLRGLRYKLQMMGIPMIIFGDNKSVLVKSSILDSVLKKKKNSITYHHICEGCARDEWRITYVKTDDNQADLLTRPLSKGCKSYKFCRILLLLFYR